MQRHIPKRIADLGIERLAVGDKVFVPAGENTPGAKGALQSSMSSLICAVLGKGLYTVRRVTDGVEVRRK